MLALITAHAQLIYCFNLHRNAADLKVSLWDLMFIVPALWSVCVILWFQSQKARTVTAVQMFVCPPFSRRLVRSDGRTASISDCNSERRSTRPRFRDCSGSRRSNRTVLCSGTKGLYTLMWIISHISSQNQKEKYKMLFFLRKMSILF